MKSNLLKVKCNDLNSLQISSNIFGPKQIRSHGFLELAKFEILFNKISSTLRCLINVRRTFINFRVFSHQYFLIRDRTFIKFESKTKIIVLFCKNYCELRAYLQIFSTQYFYLDPYVYCFFKICHPVRLFGPVRLLGTYEYASFLLNGCEPAGMQIYRFFPLSTFNWTRMFNVFSKFATPYVYLDPYIYQAPKSR